MNNLEVSNNEIYINNKIEFKSNKRPKYIEEKHNIILPSEHKNFNSLKLNVKSLKYNCKHYKLKVGGNKNDLQERLYNFLLNSYSAKKIQKKWKEQSYKRYIKSKGPALFDRKACVNDIDFFTMQKIEEIENSQFISYKDADNFIYGFEIISLYNIFKRIKNNEKALNPYNRNIIPDNVLYNLNHIIKNSMKFNEKIQLETEEDTIDEEKQLELKGLSAFQHIQTTTSYIVDHLWWWNLNAYELNKFIKELCDIWEYRAGLTQESKNNICPPYGRLIHPTDFRNINLFSLINLKRLSLNMIERLTRYGNTQDVQILGANYVLCALTLVNSNVAEQYPWLYQSVA